MRRSGRTGALVCALAGMGVLVVGCGQQDNLSMASQYAGEKVTICHVPPGKPENSHTITVGAPAATAHLANHPGDFEGSCEGQNPCAGIAVTATYCEGDIENGYDFDVSVSFDGQLSPEATGVTVIGGEACMSYGSNEFGCFTWSPENVQVDISVDGYLCESEIVEGLAGLCP